MIGTWRGCWVPGGDAGDPGDEDLEGMPETQEGDGHLDGMLGTWKGCWGTRRRYWVPRVDTGSPGGDRDLDGMLGPYLEGMLGTWMGCWGPGVDTGAPGGGGDRDLEGMLEDQRGCWVPGRDAGGSGDDRGLDRMLGAQGVMKGRGCGGQEGMWGAMGMG